MKKYIGTKTVQATPAVRKGGKVYLPGDEIPKSMEPVEEGYKVAYQDGYESWSPKDVFESAYHLAETALDRINIEYSDLLKKSEKLNAFINSEKFSELDDTTKAMLRSQNEIMTQYMAVLGRRSTKMETGIGGYCGIGFGAAITLLKNGYVIRRSGWNGKNLIVFKQVPAHIDGNIIPNMQSLPLSAKKIIMDGKCAIDYTSQCLIYNCETGKADSWVPSISDVFAEDWELVTE